MKPNRWNFKWVVIYSIATTVLQTNLSLPAATVADWTFEEGVPGQAVTQVQDYSGNGHTGSIVWGSPVFVQSGPGSQGNASVSFAPGPPGSGFSPTNSPAFNIQEFTLEIAFKPGTSDPSYGALGGYLIGGFVPNAGAVYGLGYRGDLNRAFFGPVSGPIPLDGQSHHLAVVYVSRMATLYIDGKSMGTTNVDLTSYYPPAGTPMRVTVGSDYRGVQWVSGIIDRVRISNQALAPQDFFDAAPQTGGCNAPSGIAAWWPGAGNAEDVIGSNNGTAQGGVTYVPGVVGEAFQFDGSAANRSCVVIPGANLANNGDTSVEAWVKPLASVTNFYSQALIFGQSFGNPQLAVVATASNTIKARYQFQAPDGSFPYVQSLSDLPIGTFTHVAGTWDGHTLGIYVNGRLENQVTPGKTPVSFTGPFFIGGFDVNYQGKFFTGQFFNGVIDEVSLYRRALTGAEVQSIYSLGSAGKCLAGSSLGDGIPDAWRLKFFGPNYVSDPRAAANADPDADGADNYQEFLAGTDPLNSNSVPVLPAIVSTYAGASGGFRDGFRTTAQFDGSITDLKYDAQGRIWLLESSVSGDLQRPDAGGQRIRILDTNGVVSTLTGGANGMVDGPLGQARFSIPNGLAFDSAGNAFLADQGNHRIRKIGTNGVVSTFAGSTAGYRDGFGINAQFNAPSGLAMDANNNLYVADWLNQKIRIITPQGAVSTFAGNYGAPVDIALGRDGTLFIADSQNGQVHRIDTTGVVSVFASGLPVPEHLSLDSQGNVYVSTANQTLEKFGADGTLKWSVGAGAGYRDGLATTAQFVQLGRALALPDGSLLVGDHDHIRQITIGIPPLLLISPGGGPFTNSVAVSISSAVGGVIRYSLDDGAPTTNSPVYTNSLTLTNTTSTTTTLRAVVFISSNAVSEVVSATFTNVFNVWREQLFGANYATDPQAAAAADPDGDGSSNYQEFLDGTNPRDANSVKIRVAARLVPAITWNSVSNKVYRVLRTDDVNSTNSIVVAPSIVATNTMTTFIDLNPNLRAFYWIDIVPAGPGP